MISPRSVATLILLAAALGAPLSGCSAAPPEPDESVGQTDEALLGGLPGVACILNCCIGGGRAFNKSDPFESQLASWGCTAPEDYSPDQLTGAWWLYTKCADPSQRVENFIAKGGYATKAPYDALSSKVLPSLCIFPAPAGYTYVVWDPTCSTCKTLLNL